MQGPARAPTASRRELSRAETQLLRQLILMQGRDPEGFSAAVLADGSISVRSPATAAFYPLEGWTSRFLRHLHQGYFDPASQPRRAGPAG